MRSFREYMFENESTKTTGLMRMVINYDDPRSLRELLSKDINYAQDVLRDINHDQFVSTADLQRVRKQIYDVTQTKLKNYSNNLTVYRIGPLSGDIDSFSLNSKFTGFALPWKERVGNVVVQYKVKKIDILAMPNAILKSGLGTESEQEVLIASDKVQKKTN